MEQGQNTHCIIHIPLEHTLVRDKNLEPYILLCYMFPSRTPPAWVCGPAVLQEVDPYCINLELEDGLNDFWARQAEEDEEKRKIYGETPRRSLTTADTEVVWLFKTIWDGIIYGHCGGLVQIPTMILYINLVCSCGSNFNLVHSTINQHILLSFMIHMLGMLISCQ